MAARTDPKLAEFLAAHARSPREAVKADVDPHRDQDPADSWSDVEQLCRDALFLLKAGGHSPAALLERDEPHPTYRSIMRRLIAERRSRVG